MNAKASTRKSIVFSIVTVAILLFAAVFLWLGSRNSSQAVSPTIAGVSFRGEYKIGNGEWQTYEIGKHIPANQGDVTLRGIFLKHNPETGEAIGTLSPGSTVTVYFNHIGGSVILPSGAQIMFDAENDLLGEDACAAMFGSFPAMGEEPITIILCNPHDYGNANAIDEFFEHMSIAPGIYLDSMMLAKGETERTVGSVVLIIAIVILGIAAFSSFIHISYSREMWLIGLMSFFAGGYFMMDAFAVSRWSEPNIFNTRALGLCTMLYMLFGTALVVNRLASRARTVGIVAVALSVASMLT